MVYELKAMKLVKYMQDTDLKKVFINHQSYIE